eukprot:TRINITY_DN27879_c0_g1_i1.p1 TRINITY_DN27879_c0_g1~~TRINITY_DN27879_c0_g1_i1.p1  ORF type:complete len:651 (-),score=138.37 TRINITY_DN27879_c0_g1_i1:297-2249(-)
MEAQIGLAFGLAFTVFLALLVVVSRWREYVRWQLARCGPRVRLMCCRRRFGHTSIPDYWINAGKDLSRASKRSSPEFFDDRFPLHAALCDELQDLLNKTSGCAGLAGGSDSSKQGFRIVRAFRLEDSVMWANYQQRAAEVRASCRKGVDWEGHGEPATAAAIQELQGHLSTVDLDDQINEAYLWHGTSPQVAFKIIEDGFRISSESTARASGARFGAGAYFAENPAKADRYAKSDKHTFTDCYAMLLCRVVLGRQDLTTAMQDNSSHSMSKHSLLAEPVHGGAREFVVWDEAQVYPEYAFVYERVGAEAMEDLEKARNALDSRDGDSDADCELPHYWTNSSSKTHRTISGELLDFEEMHPAPEMKDAVQALVDQTWQNTWTGDRKTPDGRPVSAEDPAGDMPTCLRVLKVLRLEGSERWREYKQAQERIESKRAEHLLPVHDVETTPALPWALRRSLDTAVNEVFLWYPSQPSSALSTDYSGLLKEPVAYEKLFGDGVYFSECSSRCDEVSRDAERGYYMGYYTMLLCRVSLGQTKALDSSKASAHRYLAEGTEYDSVTGADEALAWYRSFVVPNEAVVYPEFVVVYERIHKDHRVRGGVELVDYVPEGVVRRRATAPARPLRKPTQSASETTSDSESDSTDDEEAYCLA